MGSNINTLFELPPKFVLWPVLRL